MAHIYILSNNPEDWKQFLADPATQWKIAYSARTLAYCWHSAKDLPPEIVQVLKTSSMPVFHGVSPLLIIPEYKIQLEGVGRDSQNDLFVLAKAQSGDLISITIEGKVNESFGEQVGKWKTKNQGFTENKQIRLQYLQSQIGLDLVPDKVYYQLLHRTASAVIEAKKFNARYAVMLVHSFSPMAKWFDEYARFVDLYQVNAFKDTLHRLATIDGIDLYSAWVSGDQRFLEM